MFQLTQQYNSEYIFTDFFLRTIAHPVLNITLKFNLILRDFPFFPQGEYEKMHLARICKYWAKTSKVKAYFVKWQLVQCGVETYYEYNPTYEKMRV